MKTGIGILATVIFVGQAEASLPCEEKVRQIVTGLETAVVDANGVAQGDYEEPLLAVRLVSQGSGAENQVNTYAVVADHMNEDGETWTQDYTVKMLVTNGLADKVYCSLESFSFDGFH